jgi:hypothetical protein
MLFYSHESIDYFVCSSSVVRWGRVLLGGPAIGGGGIGLILVICLIVYCMGGFRRTKT